MKLNEPTLADPLLLTGCALGGPPWGSGGPFTTQDLISTTTFPDDNLLLSSPPPHHHGVNNNNNSNSSPPSSALKGGSPPNGSTGVELDALLIVGSSDSFAELKPLPPFEYAAAGTTVVVGALSLQNDPHLPQMGPAPNQHNSHHHNSSNNNSSNRDNHNHPNPHRNGGGGGSTGNSLVNSPNGTNFSSSVGGSPLFDPVSSSTSVPANIKSELAEYLLNSDIDDIAALIGNAIADSTVPNLGLELDPNGVSSSADTPDPWMEFETWIESACQQSQQQQQQQSNGGGGGGPGRGPLQQNGQSNNPNNPNANNVLLDPDTTIHTSASEQSFLDGSTSTLQTLLEADSYSSGPQNNPMFHQDIKHNPAEFHPTSILQSRLQQPILGGQLLRVTSGGNGGSNNGNGGGGPNTSPSQLPESTTHQQHHPNSIYGLKVDPYTLDPGSPTYIDSLTGEVNQRPHTTHVSPPAVVTSSMMSGGGGGGGGNGPNSNNNKYRKQYKISNNKQQQNGGGGPFHHPSPDGNTFLSHPYGGPTSSPFDTSPNGMNNGHHHQVSYCPSSSSHNDPPRWSPYHEPGHWQSKEQSKLGIKTKRKSSKLPSSSTLGIDPLDPCGKEKPVHRCNICNRGFLNKSNIKVHLRTHTGEKPFKCDVCGKAFRQKAHLLKHVQIHKRIQRD